MHLKKENKRCEKKNPSKKPLSQIDYGEVGSANNNAVVKSIRFEIAMLLY